MHYRHPEGLSQALKNIVCENTCVCVGGEGRGMRSSVEGEHLHIPGLMLNSGSLHSCQY